MKENDVVSIELAAILIKIDYYDLLIGISVGGNSSLISADAAKFAASIVFIMNRIGSVQEVQHVCSDEQVPQGHKIRVIQVLNYKSP